LGCEGCHECGDIREIERAERLGDVGGGAAKEWITLFQEHARVVAAEIRFCHVQVAVATASRGTLSTRESGGSQNAVRQRLSGTRQAIQYPDLGLSEFGFNLSGFAG